MADETDEASTDSAPAEKTAAKKAPAKKAPAKKQASSAGSARKRTSSRSGTRTSAESSRPNAVSVARSAREQLGELLNKDSETVIGVQRTDEGWEVDLEVVDTPRIPNTTDVMAIYRVQLDDAGDIEGYHRLERYIRGKADGGGARD